MVRCNGCARRFQKQNRALAQVSIAEQPYHPETNAVDFTFQIDPGPVVVIYARGFHISRGVLKKEIPVYEENAVDDDLLNEGKRNLLDYLQTRGHFDAKVEIQKETDAKTLRVIYQIDPGPAAQTGAGRHHRQQEFSGYREAAVLHADSDRPAAFSSHGRYSGDLLKSDVATLEGLYRSQRIPRGARFETKVDDNYQGRAQQAGSSHSH